MRFGLIYSTAVAGTDPANLKAIAVLAADPGLPPDVSRGVTVNRESGTRRRGPVSSEWVTRAGGDRDRLPVRPGQDRIHAVHLGVVGKHAPATEHHHPSEHVAVGDVMSALVTATGREVTFMLADATEHLSSVKRIRPRDMGQRGAEWIEDAPTGCAALGYGVLKLANVGSVTFFDATRGRPATGDIRLRIRACRS